MNQLRIAVTGTGGQLARAMTARAGRDSGIEVVALGRPQLDLARPESVAPALAGARPDVVVNAAAFTAVDQAEDERDQAYKINHLGAEAAAAAAAALGVPILQISTDYVFDGEGGAARAESDPVAPKSVYGASKLAGERAAAAANPDHVILRTAWVYSPFGKSFVKTMMALAESRDSISVVADQFGSPTSAFDLADGVIEVARQIVVSPSREKLGVFHLAGGGEANWADVAEEVMLACRALGAKAAEIRRISSAEYPSKAALAAQLPA